MTLNGESGDDLNATENYQKQSGSDEAEETRSTIVYSMNDTVNNNDNINNNNNNSNNNNNNNNNNKKLALSEKLRKAPPFHVIL